MKKLLLSLLGLALVAVLAVACVVTGLFRLILGDGPG